MRLTLLSLLFLFSQLAFSQDAVEVVYDGISDSGSRAKARQEIFKEAIEKTSEKYIIDIVGEEKFSKNKAIIKSNIIKNSGKYILFIKAQKIDSSGPGTKVSVQLKLSLDSLRQLLLREGLFYLAEGPPQVLPLVTFQDKVNSRSFSWWSAAPESDNAMNIQQAQQLSRELKKSLRGHGFFGLQPVRHSFFKMIPSVYQSTNPRTDDYLFLGEFFRSPIIVKGSVKTDKDREQPGQFVVSVKLEALQSVNGRIIGEISRRYETEQGPFASVVGKKFEEVLEKASSDLVVQIHDAWKRGTFGSSLIRLTFKGPLNFKQVEQLRKLIEQEVRGIKSLRERLMASNRFTFLVDSSVGTQQLADTIKGKKFPRFKVEVSDVGSGNLDLNVKAW